MPCKLCLSDPQPSNFGSPRKCAFSEEGEFTPDNWACASVTILLESADRQKHLADIYGCDEAAGVVTVLCHDDPYSTNGFLVFTRYKQRGRTSSIVHVGDFYPPEKVTLEMIEEQIRIRQERRR